LGTNVVWQCALSANHGDRREEKVALVDEACGKGLAKRAQNRRL
jgi:hypothetical protein